VLEAADAVALADRLQTEIDAGHAARYAQLSASELEALPKVPCALCEGAGGGNRRPKTGAGDVRTGIRCNGCDGDDFVPNSDAHYSFDVDNLKHFAAFLRDSGGFSIY
jgi:hypothetical protein